MIISFLQQKGGSGKSTLSLNVAYELASQGSRVLLVDSDPQGSARDWVAMRSQPAAFPIVGIDRPTLHQDVPRLAKDYDHVVIDGAPRVTDLTRSAIMASDLIIVPCQPSQFDLWASRDVVDLFNEAKIYKDSLKCKFVINRRIGNTLIGNEIRDAIAQYGLPVLETTIAQRVVFADALNLGATVQEIDPTGAAAREIQALTEEILNAST